MQIEPAAASFAQTYAAGRPQVVWTRLVADLETPVSAFLKVASRRPLSFLLESVEGGATRGRYSVIGLDPDVVWRAGLDLNPLDVRDDEDVRWLDSLVWPEQTDRFTVLRSAVALARQDPAPIHRGDLTVDLDLELRHPHVHARPREADLVADREQRVLHVGARPGRSGRRPGPGPPAAGSP